MYSPGSLQDQDTLIEQSDTEITRVKCIINNQYHLLPASVFVLLGDRKQAI